MVPVSATTMPPLPPVLEQAAASHSSSAAGRGARDQKAIDSAANGFESIFTSMILKEMRKSLDGESMFGKDEGDVMGGLFDFYIGQHLASGGSLGIANMVKKHWEMGSNHRPLTPSPSPQGGEGRLEMGSNHRHEQQTRR